MANNVDTNFQVIKNESMFLLDTATFNDKQEIINETTFGCHLDVIFKVVNQNSAVSDIVLKFA